LHATVIAMQLLIIRHAIAEDKVEFARTGRDDTERPLTREGKRQMRHVVKGMRRVVRSLDVLASSPLVRAEQTAAIVAEEYDEISIDTVPELSPESDPAAFARWLRTQSEAKVVAVVGHEPHLGMLTTWLMTGSRESHVTLEKGGACMLEIDEQPGTRSATLQWSLTPEVMKKLSKK
jgi:phosphohistidine phosphatase